ncbi:protein N-terminal asparagine amidohydrolase isoform X2 [Halyomorpha halys]|uniref:protein N-terminal asparagine amidohydrolase isoform X2 n=1 Tax=Halyomorpha halys TaxID=286706 RepID=UPI0006D51D40
MTVTVGGVPLEEPLPDTSALVHAHPQFRESAARLTTQPPKVVGPVGLLYVQQREMAVTVPHDKNVSILGSEDATTCIILVLRHTTSGAVGLAHCDGAGTEEGLVTLISRIQELALGYPEGRMQLQLVGGYLDANNYTEELFYNILHVFHKQPIEIELITACVSDVNTVVRNGIHAPIIYGVGFNVKTGEIFPATFPDKGPEQSLRTARHLSASQPTMLDVYDCGLGLLRIGPFSYQPLRGVDLWLEQSDDIILQHLSTSPQVEPPHFTMQIRAALKYIQENPFPAVTVFRENRPHYYRRDELTGIWTPFSY